MPNDPKTYQFDLPTTGRPTDVQLPETWYPGIRDFWSSCTTKRSVHPIDGIRAIVIHATAGGNSAGAVSVMKAGTASFHWLVPDEDEPQHGQLVWACAPEALAAWHVRNDKSHPTVNGGKDRVNHWSLGIEVVNTQVGADAFSDWQVSITAQIVRYCWAKYPNLRHIVSHARMDPRGCAFHTAQERICRLRAVGKEERRTLAEFARICRHARSGRPSGLPSEHVRSMEVTPIRDDVPILEFTFHGKNFNLWFSLQTVRYSHFTDSSARLSRWISFVLHGKSHLPVLGEANSFLTTTLAPATQTLAVLDHH